MQDLFEFPCLFPIKIMGEKNPELKNIIHEILKKHIEETYVPHILMDERESSGGKYLSITAKFTASSKEQLDNIYRELSSHKAIKVVL